MSSSTRINQASDYLNRCGHYLLIFLLIYTIKKKVQLHIIQEGHNAIYREKRAGLSLYQILSKSWYKVLLKTIHGQHKRSMTNK